MLHATLIAEPTPCTIRRGGFTLIEVMVALLILSVMAAMAWQGVDGMARSREVAQDNLSRTLRLQTVIAQWEADLHAVVDTQTVPALSFDGATVRMTRSNPQGVQVVLWTLRGKQWLRWAGPGVTTVNALQEQWMRSLQYQGKESGQLVAFDGVQQWQIYCFVGSTWSNCQSTGNLVVAPVSSASAAAGSSTTPPPATAGVGVGSAAGSLASLHQALPSGVRLRVDFDPSSRLTGAIHRDVAVL